MTININSETGLLKSIILGTANDRNQNPNLNNPKYADIIKRGKDPSEADMVREMEQFRAVLEDNEVKVLRPQNISNYDQMFCRDIGFAVGDHFFIANMRKKNRQVEIEAIQYLVDQFEKVHIPPADAIIEGGDIIVWKQYVFVGLGDRTNEAGITFLKQMLAGEKEVIPIKIKATDDPKTNVLHLDCAFQPIGLQYGVIYKEGFIDLY
jgi:N-dimethylarginine dimethylaminohydrolase